MINKSSDIATLLKELGERLRAARLARNESQELFAQRLGITRQSYSKMEKGWPQTPIGSWLAAAAILGRLEGWQGILADQPDLFAQLERNNTRRQRAGSKRQGKG
jgi:transcriptional regulator with XRE-family HTH domain